MNHRPPKPISRRHFLGATAGALAAPLFVPAAVLGEGKPAPSQRLNIGIIGLGSRGFNLLQDFLKAPDAQIVALCDVDSLHYRDRTWGEGMSYGCEPAKAMVDKHYAGVSLYADFRELCAHPDLDAVVIATPDHWHALCVLEALKHNLDIYCEKPVSHTFHEGQVIYRQVAKSKAVFQTGSQQRSYATFRQAVELVLNGHLGAIRRIEVGLPPGYDEPQGDTTVQEPPEHLDYDLWCGPSPKLPYMRARHHRWWRGHRAYGGGVLMDWIGHHNDIAHWSLGLDKSGPSRVEAVGWTFPETDVYNTPHHYEIRCEYPGGVTSSISDQHSLGTKWIGEEGWLHICRKETTASDERWTKPGFETGSVKVYNSPDHVRNFLDCCISREACVTPPETAHRSITPGHLGYVSQALGRSLEWDAENEKAINDQEANTILQMTEYRKPWSLETA